MTHADNDGVIYQGHVLDVLRKMEPESVDCCITSPPYWGLRSYKTEPQIWGGSAECEHNWNISPPRRNRNENDSHPAAKQATVRGSNYNASGGQFCSLCGAWRGELGLEPDFNLYLDHLLEVFREVKRVLKKTGTCWVNIGDTYSGSWGNYGARKGKQRQQNVERFERLGTTPEDYLPGSAHCQIPPKSLCQIPSRFAIRMSDDGWILRNTIIWWKRNCMPSSAPDRLTVDFEPIFFFTKSPRYWFERQFEPQQECSIKRAFSLNHLENRKDREDKSFAISSDAQDRAYIKMREKLKNGEEVGRNKRCVWDIPTNGFKEAHFATFPEDLPVTPIKAGCPEYICTKCGKAREKIFKETGELWGGSESTSKTAIEIGASPTSSLLTKSVKAIEFSSYTDCNCGAPFVPGIVLDPFMGSGTVALVAKRLRRRYIGIELQPKYIRMAARRLAQEVLI